MLLNCLLTSLLSSLLSSPVHAELPPREVLLDVQADQQRIDRLGMSTLKWRADAPLAIYLEPSGLTLRF